MTRFCDERRVVWVVQRVRAVIVASNGNSEHQYGVSRGESVDAKRSSQFFVNDCRNALAASDEISY